MRNGRREVLRRWIAFAMIAACWSASRLGEMPAMAAGDLSGMTVELDWRAPGDSGVTADGRPADGGLRLSLSEGQIPEIIDWSNDPTVRIRPVRGTDGTWDLGIAASGRVRARLETNPAAEIIVRWADHVVRVPVAAVLERPQTTPSQSPLSVGVRRLPWDSLMVDLGAGAEDGIVEPSATVPLSVRYNLLAQEATDMLVRTSLALRPIGGGEPIWRDEQRHVVPTNCTDPLGRGWNLRAPAQEGTYILEVQASWEPYGAREPSRLGRLIWRKKPSAGVSSATRRVAVAVVAPQAPDAKNRAPANPPREVEVENVEFARVRSTRFVSLGRSPLLKPGRRAWDVPEGLIADWNRREHDRIRGWIGRTVPEAGHLGPADESGLAWSALALRVNKPELPHRLTITVAGGDPAALGVAVVDPGGGGRRSRLLLDASATGPPILNAGPAATFSWVLWPDCSEPLLVLLNRNPAGPVKLGSVKLSELPELTAPLPDRQPRPASLRHVGLQLSGPAALDRFGGLSKGQADSLQVARNLVSYLGHCGASMVILPEGIAERELRRRLRGQAVEDSTGPDQLELLLHLIHRQGYSALQELKLDGEDALPGLPPPDSAEALSKGLVRVDRRGLADGRAYHPLHPEVRQAMKRRVELAMARRPDGSSLDGLLIQLGPGHSLLGRPDTGLDDETYLRFVKETFGPETRDGIPGPGTTDPERFAARAKYLSGVGRMPWLNWRSRAIASLYTELSDAVNAAAPGARLAVMTPTLHTGAAGAEARRVDLAGLAPSQAWRSVGLDLEVWPGGPTAPIVLRGVELSEDPLAHDLATSPDLDAKVAQRSHRGVLLTTEREPADPHPVADPPPDGELDDPAEDRPGQAAGVEELADDAVSSGSPGGLLRLCSQPLGDGTSADEPLGHAVAAIDSQWVVLTATAVAGFEDRIRRFATVLRALPAGPAQPGEAAELRRDFGIAVRSFSEKSESFLELANDTPYPIRLAGILETPPAIAVEDLGRNLRLMPEAVPGGRQLVVDLMPFGVSAIRIAAPGVRLKGITPYPSEAVMTSMEARYRELSNQLARLNRGPGIGLGSPPNPGFEPERPTIHQTHDAPEEQGAASSLIPTGWTLSGGKETAITLDREKPHGGGTSLKISAVAAPASVVSGSFVPAGALSLELRAYFRAEPADARVRVWIEGEAGGRDYVRQSEIQVPSEWEARGVRARDLPAGGLDNARLRFELLTPGVLWIDDLKILGETTPEAVRANAQRTLLAALQAYRVQRYAEFARLSRSHWARHPSLLATGLASPPAQLSGIPGAVAPEPAAASALPPDRRVR